MDDAVVKNNVGVLGATSLVGASLLPQLTEAGYQVKAFSRQINEEQLDGVDWQQLSLPSIDFINKGGNTPYWICVAPIWVLPDYFSLLEVSGVRRVVVLSSTSRFTKGDSSDFEEQAVAQRLIDAENCVQAWAEDKSVEWVILRPTLIYGFGRDKNISEIARIISKFGFFPLFGDAMGFRQPVHAEDLASACVTALNGIGVVNQGYNISGGEILTYREMIARVFVAMGRPVRMVSLPLCLFRITVALLRCLPRYRYWSVAMAERMNRDLSIDHGDAVRDLDFNPRGFVLTAEDLPR